MGKNGLTAVVKSSVKNPARQFEISQLQIVEDPSISNWTEQIEIEVAQIILFFDTDWIDPTDLFADILHKALSDSKSSLNGENDEISGCLFLKAIGFFGIDSVAMISGTENEGSISVSKSASPAANVENLIRVPVDEFGSWTKTLNPWGIV